MPYHKNSQQAFQAAQQGAKEARDVYEGMIVDGPDYGSQIKHLKEEVIEAYQQIQNALEVATETQRDRLEQYQRDLETMVDKINQES
ncbi:hypothetical protein LC087_04540 [Bacillus carboniphilus]|uniref:Small, acid-soluble spore protein N n=1 Tax=Bacillus carboniphilus TaxID=86663 RepID=A0ABY9K0S4_9BACI|nr:hypothetical protein [Bacillus carboniphilus]WLR43445.1 hypothetical protein LC087_04540 [Bacillus carboniphilus]